MELLLCKSFDLFYPQKEDAHRSALVTAHTLRRCSFLFAPILICDNELFNLNREIYAVFNLFADS